MTPAITPTPFVSPLQGVNRRSVGLAGGKAASLGELLAAGIPVPPGFVITTRAFRTGLTPAVKQQILAAYHALGAGRVAVRSSAVAEDSGAASWAGQLDTSLNVNAAGLIDAVRRCWDSIKSAHAQEYARRHHIPAHRQAVAVVVQAMVESDRSGVMFTVNPITQDGSQIMIEAAYGLGELLVQGQITPENLVANKASGHVLQRRAGTQDIQLAFQNGRTRELPIYPPAGGAVLSETQVRELVDLARRIEQHYGAPQDIEWAISGPHTYIVQSRPITTLGGPKAMFL